MGAVVRVEEMKDAARVVARAVEEMQVVTQGDRVLDRALSEVGGKGCGGCGHRCHSIV